MLCPTLGTVTSFFGIRTDPVYEGTEKHCGIDIAGPLWSPVIGTADGIVSFAGWGNRYGNLVVIDHMKSGIQTIYGHMQKIVVRRGDHIIAGQKIGYIGSTGKSTGPHLHYEVRKNGIPVNPISYLLSQNVVSD
jgi:murein DD-endopeptidase MepM/ murein hydrolase activator NlpD